MPTAKEEEPDEGGGGGGDITAPDLDDPDASLSSTAAHKLARKGRKAQRAAENAQNLLPASVLIPRDRQMAKASLAKQRAVFTGTKRTASQAATGGVDAKAMPPPPPPKRTTDGVLSVRDTKSKTRYTKKNPSSTTTMAQLFKALYSNLFTAQIARRDGTIITDPTEAKRIIDAGEYEVPEYKTSHIRLLSRQCGEWTLDPKAGAINYPGCAREFCVIAYDRTNIKNLRPAEAGSRRAARPIVILSPDEIGDAMAVKRAKSRPCFWCACFYFGIFLSHYREVSPGQIVLPDTEVQQPFRVKCDAEEGFHGAYLLPYTNGTCGGGITDGVPRADLAMMTAEYVGERYVLNFDQMCFGVRVPGTGGTASRIKDKIETSAFAVLDSLTSDSPPRTPERDDDGDDGKSVVVAEDTDSQRSPKRQKVDSTPSLPVASSSSSTASSFADQLLKFTTPTPPPPPPPATKPVVAATSSSSSGFADSLLKFASPQAATTQAAAAAAATQVNLTSEFGSNLLKFAEWRPFHNANSRVEAPSQQCFDKASGSSLASSSSSQCAITAALDKYRPILAKLCRGPKRDVRGTKPKRGGGGGGGGGGSSAATRKEAKENANAMAIESMMVCMNPVLLRSRSECRRRVAGLFASIHTLATTINEPQFNAALRKVVSPFVDMFTSRVDDAKRIITRYSNKAERDFTTDCPRFSELPLTDVKLTPLIKAECATLRARDDLYNALYDACMKADAGRLETVVSAHPQVDVTTQFSSAFRTVVRETLGVTAAWNAFRFAILYKWWTTFRQCASELEFLKPEPGKPKGRQKSTKPIIHPKEYRQLTDVMGRVDFHLAVNMDVFWYTCYSLLARVYERMPCMQGAKSVCPAFKVHSEREDVIDPLYDSEDVIDEMTLPALAEFLERSFLDTDAQSKRVPLTHILDKCLPRRSSWRMGEGVTRKYMEADEHFRTYVIQVVVCALLGNYSDIPLGFRARWKTRCFLYHSYYQAVGSTGDAKDDPWQRRATEAKSSLFKSLIGSINRFCLHAFHRHIRFVAKSNPHIEWSLKSLFAFDKLMAGADDVLASVRVHAVEQTDVLMRTFESGATQESFEKRHEASHAALQAASKEAEKKSKMVLEVVPLPKKLSGFVNAVQSLVTQIPIMPAREREALNRERRRHRAIQRRDGISDYRYEPAGDDDVNDDDDDNTDAEFDDDDEEDARGHAEDALTARLTAAAPELGRDDDDFQTGESKAAADDAEPPPPQEPELSGSFKTMADFGLPRKLVLLIEQWVNTHCDTRHKFPDSYIFELFEMAGLGPSRSRNDDDDDNSKDHTTSVFAWLEYLTRQFQLEAKLKDDLQQFAIRYPLAYAIMQTFCAFYRRRTVLQVVPLPQHYRDAQIAASKARFHLGPDDEIPESAHVIEYCAVCQRIFNVVRENIGPGHVIGKDGGYVNMTVSIDFGEPDRFVFRCNGRDMFAGRSCMTEPTAKISLIGNAVIYRGEVITLCPQPGCGVPSIMCGTRSVKTTFGAACGDCSLCLAAASLELQASGRMPLTSTHCFAARYLVSMDRRAREIASTQKKKRPVPAVAAAAAAVAAPVAGAPPPPPPPQVPDSSGTFSAYELRSLCDILAREKLAKREADLLMAKANVGGALRCQICSPSVDVVIRKLLDMPIAMCRKHKTGPMMKIMRRMRDRLKAHPQRICPPGAMCQCDGFREHKTCDGKLNMTTVIEFLKFYVQPGSLSFSYGHMHVYEPKKTAGGGGGGGAGGRRRKGGTAAAAAAARVKRAPSKKNKS